MLGTLLASARILAILALSAGLLAACADDDDDDTDAEDLRPITATPTAVAGLPEDMQETQLAVEGGEFEEDTLRVIVEQPVLLTVDNRDDETYTFVVDPIITETEIPAAAETPVNFNAPNQGEFEGQLLDADGEEVDTIIINVEGPGGT